MQIIAHDPARFAGLPGYSFAENWPTIDLGEGHSGRMHYLDEGPKPHAMLPRCGHFSQENHPETLTQGVIAMVRKAGFLA